MQMEPRTENKFLPIFQFHRPHFLSKKKVVKRPNWIHSKAKLMEQSGLCSKAANIGEHSKSCTRSTLPIFDSMQRHLAKATMNYELERLTYINVSMWLEQDWDRFRTVHCLQWVELHPGKFCNFIEICYDMARNWSSLIKHTFESAYEKNSN